MKRTCDAGIQGRYFLFHTQLSSTQTGNTEIINLSPHDFWEFETLGIRVTSQHAPTPNGNYASNQVTETRITRDERYELAISWKEGNPNSVKPTGWLYQN